MALLIKYGFKFQGIQIQIQFVQSPTKTIKLIVSISLQNPQSQTSQECVSISNIIRGGIDNEPTLRYLE